MSRPETAGTSLFVCPFCERTFEQSLTACSNCDSTVVLPLECQSAYDSILSMCRK
ncbi:hypothetical protein [Haloarcula rubripromontorii]|uniref:Uncharacterized protein n=1 Tax=Haloarcula rubripromontorii TaxID=1705562 RepID=A0A847TVE8_9EURY|nr:hypothetical protein [Haloarcula rubripromontorii]NLV05015.1 hypothetical protein [Haloarcula rubripromontorii]